MGKIATIKTITADFAIIHGPIQEGDPVFGAGFGKDIADMVVNGSFADHQLACDFLIGLTGGQQFNNLQFPRGDVVTHIPMIGLDTIMRCRPDYVRGLGCVTPEIVLSAAGGHGQSALDSHFR